LTDDINHQAASTYTYFHPAKYSGWQMALIVRRPGYIHTFTL